MVLTGAQPVTGSTDAAFFSNIPDPAEVVRPIVIEPVEEPTLVEPAHCTEIAPTVISPTSEEVTTSAIHCSEIPVAVPHRELPLVTNVPSANMEPAMTTTTTNSVRLPAVPPNRVSKPPVLTQQKTNKTVKKAQISTSNSRAIARDSMICEVDTSGDSSSRGKFAILLRFHQASIESV